MRSSDPFAEVEVDRHKSVLLAIATLLAAVLYTMVFPTQAAIVAVILAFFVMIMLHEFGHFIMAKRAGMKVTEFFVGFGPRLWSFRRGETEYGLKAIPLGGYCKIIGMTNLEEVAPEDEPRAYRSKTWGQKVSTVVAGPVVHFLIAIVLMFTVLFFAGDYHGSRATLTLEKVTQGAFAAGLRPGDTIVAINGTQVTDWETQVPALITNNSKAKPGDPVTFVVRRGGQVFTTTVLLQVSSDKQLAGRVVAGVSPQNYVPHPGLGAAVAQAPREVADFAWVSVKAVGSMFSPAGVVNYFHILSGDKAKNVDQTKRFLSPVGAGRATSQAVHAGWTSVFALLILINIFVGIFNLLPLLPFDGGFIAIATYERIASWIRGRRVQADVTKLMPLTIAVVAILGFIFFSSLFLDITHPIANPF